MLVLENKDTKEIIYSPVGYSWTMLITIFVGGSWIIPLYRKNYNLFLFCYIVPAVITFLDLIYKNTSIKYYTLGAISIYYIGFVTLTFFYNQLFLKKLLQQNYKIINSPEGFADSEYLKKTITMNKKAENIDITDLFEDTEKTEEEILQILKSAKIKRIIIVTLIFIVNLIIMFSIINKLFPVQL